VLFELDALTFLVYVGVLWFVAEPPPAAPPCRERSEARTAVVLRHRTFLGLWSLNFLFVAAGYSLLNLLPQFARDHSHISEREIGLVFAVNTFVIVDRPAAVSRWIEGRRRLRALALMPALWAVAWLLVDGAGAWTRATEAFVLFGVAAGILGRRRVPARPGAPGARREHRPCRAARPVLRRPLRLLGTRRNPRAGRRRLHSRRRAVCALADRSGRVRYRRARLARSGALRAARAPPHPPSAPAPAPALVT
jgi:hypothetical protein